LLVAEALPALLLGSIVPKRAILPAHRPFFSKLLLGKNEPEGAPFQRAHWPEFRSVAVAVAAVAAGTAGRRLKARVADAPVEADPIDASGTSPGVSIA
jgi:hypothetical protein